MKAEESLGMSMVFNLASAVKEWLDDNNISKEMKEKLVLQKIEEAKEVTTELPPSLGENLSEFIIRNFRLI